MTTSEQRKCCKCRHVSTKHVTTRNIEEPNDAIERTKLDCKKGYSVNNTLGGCHFALQRGSFVPEHLQLDLETFPALPDGCAEQHLCTSTYPFDCDRFELAVQPTRDVGGYGARP